MDSVPVRVATALDLAAVVAIYADEVRRGTASFEIEPPSLAEIKQRWVDAVSYTHLRAHET